MGLVPSAILERIRKLEDRGVIKGYSAQRNPQILGSGLLAFVFVRADERVPSSETAKRLAQIPEVQEVHSVAGEDCLLVKVRTADTEAPGRLLQEKFRAIESVQSTRTTIVLQTAKETAALPRRMAEQKDADPVKNASQAG